MGPRTMSHSPCSAAGFRNHVCHPKTAPIIPPVPLCIPCAVVTPAAASPPTVRAVVACEVQLRQPRQLLLLHHGREGGTRDAHTGRQLQDLQVGAAARDGVQRVVCGGACGVVEGLGYWGSRAWCWRPADWLGVRPGRVEGEG